MAVTLEASSSADAAAPPDGGGAGVQCNSLSCQLDVTVPGKPAVQAPAPAAPGQPTDRAVGSGVPAAPPPPPLPSYGELPGAYQQAPNGAATYGKLQCVVGSSAGCLGLTNPDGSPFVDKFGRAIGVLVTPPAPGGAGAPAAGAPAVPVVAPAELARRAISELAIGAPPIRMAPPPGSEGATIGFPVWMWLDRGEATTGPITRSASAGGITVTATARLQQVVWDMGDGMTVTCHGPGTVFTLDRAGEKSPDCGYLYTRRSPGYTVTATSYWQVTWQGGGQTGQDALQARAQTQLPVREIRTLNTIPGGG